MDKISLLKEGIKNFSGLTTKHCEVVNALIDISIDQPITIKIDVLCDVTGLKRSTVFFAIKELQKKGIIHKEPKRQGAIHFQSKKIKYYTEMQNNLSKIQN
jgi:predicted transcriptional regulator